MKTRANGPVHGSPTIAQIKANPSIIPWSVWGATASLSAVCPPRSRKIFSSIAPKIPVYVSDSKEGGAGKDKATVTSYFIP